MYGTAAYVSCVVDWREERKAAAQDARKQACFDAGGDLLDVLSCGKHVETCTRAGHPVAWRVPK
jgi:hypothetical protein